MITINCVDGSKYVYEKGTRADFNKLLANTVCWMTINNNISFRSENIVSIIYED